MTAGPCRIWIAEDPEAPGLFGLTPAERLRRTLRRAGLADAPVETSGGHAPLAERLGAALAGADRPLLVLDGGAATDPRLVAALARANGPLVARTAEGAALRLPPGTSVPAGADSLPALADALLAAGLPPLDQRDFDGFVGVLRRDLPFWILRPRSRAQADAAERWMFHANYKGSTDILTSHVFPPLVWPLTRWCAARGITPNAVTILSILLTVLAAVLFWQGALALGLVAAFAMAVLDSVDGKLARVTLTDSALGNVLDHGLDIVHPPFWWLAWAHGAIALGGPEWLWPAAWAMTGFYIADRLVLMVAKARFGRGLHAMTPLDGRVRAVISRRNINLLILTVGLVLGLETVAFALVVAWQAATCLWHAARTAILYPRGAATA